jgi:predicted double-glycine peptidase
VKKPTQLKDNFLTDEFDLGCNQERIFSWDGLKYINYFKPVNHAIVTKERGKVNGPLTAGIIPWGHGNYTLQSLSHADITGLETEIDSHKYLQLTILRTDGTEETFLLDPDQGFVVKQYSAHLPDNVFILRVYDSYSQIAGKWCPGSILTERYDTSQSPHRLLARDIWDFAAISEQRPSAADFEVHYDIDAYIEDFCFGTEPLQYRYSAPQSPSAKRINTDELIGQRLMIATATGRQNCATASLKYICDNLGIDPSPEKLSTLANNENSTTLAQIKQFADSLGLATCAVKADIKTLKNLRDYQAIVHLPAADHFAVLGDIDDKYVRLIDLSSDSFYNRYSIENFDSIWDGTVLLVSKTDVTLAGRFIEISSNRLNKMVGASDCQQCNNPCSSSGNSPCTYVPPSCGVHTIYYSRTCCGSATSGSCSESSLIYKKTETCDLNGDLDCDGNGDWTSSTMSACG